MSSFLPTVGGWGGATAGLDQLLKASEAGPLPQPRLWGSNSPRATQSGGGQEETPIRGYGRLVRKTFFQVKTVRDVLL